MVLILSQLLVHSRSAPSCLSSHLPSLTCRDNLLCLLALCQVLKFPVTPSCNSVEMTLRSDSLTRKLNNKSPNDFWKETKQMNNCLWVRGYFSAMEETLWATPSQWATLTWKKMRPSSHQTFMMLKDGKARWIHICGTLKTASLDWYLLHRVFISWPFTWFSLICF